LFHDGSGPDREDGQRSRNRSERPRQTSDNIAMNGPKRTNRRAVLKAVTATAVGGSIVTGTASLTQDDTTQKAGGRSNVVKVIAGHGHEEGEHEFTLSTDEIPSGWTTFELENTTGHAHFAYLSKVPQAAIDEADSQGRELLDYWVEHITRPFQWLMDTMDNGKKPDPDDRFSDEMLFPAWFGDVLPSGGVGLTAGHRTSATTVNLDPGEYIIECYVKNADNDFHSYLGMIESLTVTDASGGAEPESTVDLSLSTDGIDAPETLEPGQQTVAVEFADQQVYDHDLGHDLNLIRFDEDTTVEDVNTWMNWQDPVQLVSDGTEPGTFLGGADAVLTPELLAGEATETAYVHVDLIPGDYAWVSEVPDPNGTGLLREFSVPFGTASGDG